MKKKVMAVRVKKVSTGVENAFSGEDAPRHWAAISENFVIAVGMLAVLGLWATKLLWGTAGGLTGT